MIHYDLFVIGGGSGGVAAARSSASLGAKVGIAESREFGGTCVNRGCMPKKWYMYASQFKQEYQAAQSLGWELVQPKFNWSTLKTHTFKEVERLNGVYESMLNNAEVEIHQGFATFHDQHTVDIAGQLISADKFLIAAGGKPYIPDIEGKDYCITSDEAFHLEQLPKKLLIIGAGYIGVEFACIFNALGVDTTLMYRADNILRGFDEDIRQNVLKEIQKKGINTVATTEAVKITQGMKGELHMCCNHGKAWEFETMMLATGRKTNLEKSGIESIGILTDEKGRIIVDEWQKTNIEHIYAIGDATNNHHDLTPVAINEGRSFADTHYGDNKHNLSDYIVPTAVFSQPQIGTVGLTEAQARAKYNHIDIYRSRFRPTKFRLSDTLDEILLLKLIVDADSDLVVGAHIVGPEAAEIIQIIGVAIRANATKADFDRTVGVHPTLAEEFVTMREKESE